MNGRTPANCPTYAEVIEAMGQRGHDLLLSSIDDFAFWQVAAEELADVYRLAWPIANDDQLVALVSTGGMLLELAALAKHGELGIAPPPGKGRPHD